MATRSRLVSHAHVCVCVCVCVHGRHGDPEAAQHSMYMDLRSNMFLGYEQYLAAISDYVDNKGKERVCECE